VRGRYRNPIFTAFVHQYAEKKEKEAEEADSALDRSGRVRLQCRAQNIIKYTLYIYILNNTIYIPCDTIQEYDTINAM
jgi:hypothetical protein